jgi:hypothetical protein
MLPIPVNKAVWPMCIRTLATGFIILYNTILIFIVCNNWQLHPYAKYLWISIILSTFHKHPTATPAVPLANSVDTDVIRHRAWSHTCTPHYFTIYKYSHMNNEPGKAFP